MTLTVSPTRGREAIATSGLAALCVAFNGPSELAPLVLAGWALLACTFALPWLARAPRAHLQVVGEGGWALSAGVLALFALGWAADRAGTLGQLALSLSMAVLGAGLLALLFWTAAGWLYVAVLVGPAALVEGGLGTELGRAALIAAVLAGPAAFGGARIASGLEARGSATGALPGIDPRLSGALTGLAGSLLIGALVRARGLGAAPADSHRPG